MLSGLSPPFVPVTMTGMTLQKDPNSQDYRQGLIKLWNIFKATKSPFKISQIIFSIFNTDNFNYDFNKK